MRDYDPSDRAFIGTILPWWWYGTRTEWRVPPL